MCKLARLVVIMLLVASTAMIPGLAWAQDEATSLGGLVPARVIEVIDQETRQIPGLDVVSTYQTLKVEILEGDQAGQIVEIEDDFLNSEAGDRLFLRYVRDVGGEIIYSVEEPDRRMALLFFVALFAVAVMAIARWQGVKALLSLVVAFAVIYYVLFPLLLKGFSPVWLSVVVSSIVLAAAIFSTHGFNREATAALGGTILVLVVTGCLAYLSVLVTNLSGFASDESVYLNFSTGGELNFQGLLLAAIIIGIIGVLDDIAITQSVAVAEIYSAAPDISKSDLYHKVLRIGREHVVALVNTLVFAYVGASLPLLLLFYLSAEPASFLLNREIFATEIIRTVIGSIGLILTVPITTYIAVFLLHGRKVDTNKLKSHVHRH